MNVEELEKLNVDHLVDARGTACPGPLLEAKRGIAAVPKGGIMEILSSDKHTNEDIPIWCSKAGHEYLGNIEDAGFWHLYVQRKK